MASSVAAKLTLISHEIDGDKVFPLQLSPIMENGAAKPNRLLMTRFALPTLLTVMLRVPLLPIGTLPKAPLPLTVISGAELTLVPVPLTLKLTLA